MNWLKNNIASIIAIIIFLFIGEGEMPVFLGEYKAIFTNWVYSFAEFALLILVVYLAWYVNSNKNRNNKLQENINAKIKIINRIALYRSFG